MEPERHDDVTYMPDLVPRGFVLRLLIAMIAISIVLCVVAYLLLRMRESALRPGRAFPEAKLGAPRQVSGLREAPFAESPSRPLLQERQRILVNSYGWVDRQKRVVHIPVKRAMELELQRAAAGAQP
jgi:hypothetical protein